jgi:hypothetical protein
MERPGRPAPFEIVGSSGPASREQKADGPRKAVRHRFQMSAAVPRVRCLSSAEHFLTIVEPDKRVFRGTATAAGVTRTYLDRIMMRSARALRALAG